ELLERGLERFRECLVQSHWLVLIQCRGNYRHSGSRQRRQTAPANDGSWQRNGGGRNRENGRCAGAVSPAATALRGRRLGSAVGHRRRPVVSTVPVRDKWL